MKLFRVILLILVSSGYIYSQDLDNRFSIWLVNGKATLPDSLIIDPSTIEMEDSTGVLPVLSYDAVSGTITVEKSTIELQDSVKINFRILKLPAVSHFGRSMTEYDSTAPFKDFGRSKFFVEENNQLFNTGNVSTSGRLSRGITVGNTRDLMVNSSLNLTLDGQLSDDLNIRASITDQRIPYQPEGNTAQLQDFDNVFVQLYNEDFDITAGDIVFSNSQSQFLRYNKNVQGIRVNTKGDKGSLQLGASQAKGKFASVSVKAIDGISGPYRIPGPNGEDFVVVLASSEKVYLDGNLLVRGFNNDYVIDYNSGEITFSTGIMITQYSRIKIDYEYADNHYNRSIVSMGYTRKIINGELYIQAYSEKDNKKDANFELSDDEINKLVQAGDNQLLAISSGEDSVGFDANKILYKKITVKEQEIFVHSTHPDSAIYEVQFTKVGPNLGDYVRTSSITNGRVYKWVSRIQDVPQGEYAPFKVLPLPSKKQMITAGGNLSLSEFESISFESSVSGNDQNQFSDFDDYDDTGGAFYLGISSENREIFNSEYKFKGGINFEYLNKHFAPVDRFRPIEFDREWTFDPGKVNEPSGDGFFEVNIGIEEDRYNRINYTMGRRVKGDNINGFQHTFQLNKEVNNFRIISSLFRLNNHQNGLNSDWKRIKTDLSYDLGSFRSGYLYQSDQSKILYGDSVKASANYFNEHLFYIRSENGDVPTQFDLGFGVREDFLPRQGRMESNGLAKTVNLQLDQNIGTNQDLKLLMIYRNVNQPADTLSESPNNNSLSSRLDYSGRFFQNILSNELTYTVANSRELRKEYVFIQVPTGEGNYQWIDSNEDGIKDISEFYPAIHFDEMNYVKIFIPTQDYVEAFENTFNYRFNLRFPRSWRKETGMKRFLQKISNTTIWTSIAKTQNKKLSSRLMTFLIPVDKSEILNLSENFRTTWFFNRTNPRYGFNLGYKLNHFINLLTGGIEEREIAGYDLQTRLNLSRSYSLKLKGSIQKEYSNSELLTDRNFIIQSNKVEPSFSWQPESNFRFKVMYKYSSRENIQNREEGESSFIHEIGGEIRYNKVKRLNLRTEVRYANVQFTGMTNSPSGYAVLAGYRPGSNINWAVSMQQKLIDGLQLSINYQGRKSLGSRFIHIGRVMVNALF